MSKKALCKFTCNSVTNYGNGFNEVKLTPQYDQTLPEDQKFSTATPSGELKATINNPALKDFFEPGKAYYIEIRPVEESK